MIQVVRLRITIQPRGTADGVDLSRFHEGFIYDVGHIVGNVLLAEGWAVPTDTEAPAFVTPSEPLDIPRKRRTILIAEDDDATRNLVGALLSHVGFTVVTARNGREALARLEGDHPDLVLLDLKMPGMDGWEFRQAQLELSSDLRDVPVALVTGTDTPEREAEALKVAHVLRKPFARRDLLTTVRRALRPRGRGRIAPR